MTDEMRTDPEIEILSTCPPSTDLEDGASYKRQVADVAKWSERQGCTGILVYSDNRMIDPWAVSQVIIEHTDRLAPLIAVQPIYMHPYTIAKKLTSFGQLYSRRFYLNMVAGGFRNDLLALNDPTPHDRRYDRLREYTRIIQELCAGDGPVTLEGEFYTVKNLQLTPPLGESLAPQIFVSSSSKAGRGAARELGAVAVKYSKPSEEEEDAPEEDGLATGVRVGIIAREQSAAAWHVARERFPEDRQGQLTRQLATKVSDSEWHEQLSVKAGAEESPASPYWLVPFENYKSMCPYLVGDYDRVAQELERHFGLGHRTFILDVPPNEEELRHTRIAFDRAVARARVTA